MFIENQQLNVNNQTDKRKNLASSLLLGLIEFILAYFKSVL